MKLAEALSIRADLQRKVSQLKGRLKDSAKVQEGDKPAENTDDLFKELDSCLVKMEDLIYRINFTNIRTVHNGETLTQMIARKDVLNLRLSVMRDVMKNTLETDRYGRNEIKYVRTVDVTELHKRIDTYAKQLRELDLKSQKLNWTTDLQ